jgi:hypothetical protein
VGAAREGLAHQRAVRERTPWRADRGCVYAPAGQAAALRLHRAARDVLERHGRPDAGKAIALEPIASGDALATAHAQRAAIVKAKWSLHTAVVNALKAHRGFHLVGIVPALVAAERPIAGVTLVKDETAKAVAERLDE